MLSYINSIIGSLIRWFAYEPIFRSLSCLLVRSFFLFVRLLVWLPAGRFVRWFVSPRVPSLVVRLSSDPRIRVYLLAFLPGFFHSFVISEILTWGVSPIRRCFTPFASKSTPSSNTLAHINKWRRDIDHTASVVSTVSFLTRTSKHHILTLGLYWAFFLIKIYAI